MTAPARVRTVFAALLAAAAAACGPAPEGETDATDSLGSEIIGGEIDEKHDAVVMLYNDQYGYTCSGTLIDEDVYLTAAHCIEGTSPSVYYIFGGAYNRYDDPVEWYRQVQAVHVHPSYNPSQLTRDIAIVILASDAPVKPYRWLADDDDGIYDEGTEFTAVGYGVTNGNSQTGDGIRRSVELTIEEVYADQYGYGSSSANTCSGDSGGPGLVVIDGYYTVIGTVSYGDATCSSTGYDQRTDYNASFISDYADPDAGTARESGGGGKKGGGNNPFACTVGSLQPSSPVPSALLVLAAIGLVARRRR